MIFNWKKEESQQPAFVAQPDKARPFLDRARDVADKGNATYALQLFANAVRFDPANIAALSLRGLASSQIAGPSGPSHLAGMPVRRQAGYDSEGNALWTAGDLLVDTVFRFKGQAADAVVVTEADFDQFTTRERRRLFVALTRARLQVAMVTSERAAAILSARLEIAQ
jgi:hypothetical protein